jgi:hypothetical protein
VSWGLWGSWPFEWGGGPTEEESVYDALASALGGREGGVVTDQDTVEDLIRQAEAIVITAATSVVESAVMQAFPEHASYLLRAQAEAARVEATDDEATRAALIEKLHAQADADMPSLEGGLAAISDRLSVVYVTTATSRVAMQGRAFAPEVVPGLWSPSGTPRDSAWPMYSDNDVIFIRYELAVGEALIPRHIREAVSRLLTPVLPGWVDFELGVTGPFYCDGFNGSLTDQTTLG